MKARDDSTKFKGFILDFKRFDEKDYTAARLKYHHMARIDRWRGNE